MTPLYIETPQFTNKKSNQRMAKTQQKPRKTYASKKRTAQYKKKKPDKNRNQILGRSHSQSAISLIRFPIEFVVAFFGTQNTFVVGSGECRRSFV